jgi:hypothetical protein
VAGKIVGQAAPHHAQAEDAQRGAARGDGAQHALDDLCGGQADLEGEGILRFLQVVNWLANISGFMKWLRRCMRSRMTA